MTVMKGRRHTPPDSLRLRRLRRRRGTLQTGQTWTLGEVGRHCPVGPSGHASPPVEDLWPRREKRDGDKGFILRR